jgi:hypothetical protein
MLPAAVHTSWVASGLTEGDATEAPMNKTHQTSTKRASEWALRRNDMGPDYRAADHARARRAQLVNLATRQSAAAH